MRSLLFEPAFFFLSFLLRKQRFEECDRTKEDATGVQLGAQDVRKDTDGDAGKHVADIVLFDKNGRGVNKERQHERVDPVPQGDLFAAEGGEEANGAVDTMEARQQVVGEITAVKRIPERHEAMQKIGFREGRQSLCHAVHVGGRENQDQRAEQASKQIGREMIEKMVEFAFGDDHGCHAPKGISPDVRNNEDRDDGNKSVDRLDLGQKRRDADKRSDTVRGKIDALLQSKGHKTDDDAVSLDLPVFFKIRKCFGFCG